MAREVKVSAEAASLLSFSRQVTLGEETVTVKTFPMVKSLKAFALIAQLTDLLGTMGEGSEILLLQIAKSAGALAQHGDGLVYKLVGLVAMPASKMRAIEDAGEDLDTALYTEGRRLCYEASTEQIVALLVAGTEAIGLDKVLGSIPNLTAVLTQQQ